MHKYFNYKAKKNRRNKRIAINSGHWVFKELTITIIECLLKEGFDITLSNAQDNQTEFNIFITTNEFQPWMSKNNINIKFEFNHYTHPENGNKFQNYEDWTRSIHFFDYKKDLRDKNIYYCPIGYSKHFDTNIKREDLRDSYFMVSMTDIRNQFKEKHNLYSNFAVGRERDKLIVTSKLNINYRAWEEYAFSPLHAALITQKGKLLLQDDCGKDDYHFYKPYIILFNDNNFKDIYDYWLHNDRERHEFENFIYEDFRKNHLFERYFYDSIGDLLDQYK